MTSRKPVRTLVQKEYLLGTQEICIALGIDRPLKSQVQMDMSVAGSLRIVVKYAEEDQ